MVGILVNVYFSHTQYLCINVLDITPEKLDSMNGKQDKLKDIESQVKAAPVATPQPPNFPNPVILGAAAFSCTDFILSAVNAGLLPPTVASGVIGPAFFYGGSVQLITGLLCFITRNIFGLLTLTSYGAFWIAVATLITLEDEGVLRFGDDVNLPIGILAVGYAILTCYLWLATFNHNLTLCVLIFMVDVQLILQSFASFGVISTIAPGAAGLFVAANGWYFSMALFINENYGKHIMPLGDPHTTPIFRTIYKGIYGNQG